MNAPIQVSNLMTKHIGTKTLLAVAMTRGQYNTYRGWDIPAGENPDDPGYLVEYTDGGQPNHPSHKGYISWSPKDVFEDAYRVAEGPLQALTFGDALHFLLRGKKLTRAGWNGKGMFVFLVNGSTFKVNRAPLLGIYPEGTEINYRPHIDMRTADGSIVPWVASQSDVLASDWQIVE